MTLSALLFNAASSAGSIFAEGSPTGEPYNLPPMTAFLLLIILIIVLVLALAYNIRAYQPPAVSQHAVDNSNEAPPEH